jgi:uncharacterized protein YidB (DUF937 family)
MSLFEQLAKDAASQLGAAAGPGAGAASTPAPGAPADLLAGIFDLLARRGLNGLLEDFKTKGLGGIFASWVATGANHPISAEQVEQGLGRAAIEAVAARLGITPDQAAALLSKFLPHVIDKMTPHGSIEAHPAAH